MKYFSNLPIVKYNNSLVRNIFIRTRINQKFASQTELFYPHTIQETSAAGVSLENLAFDYYDDPNSVWIIRLINNMIDPYYDTYLDQEQFSAYLNKRYGSIQNASKKIIFYVNNWAQDDSVITPARYDSLSSELKIYYKPAVNRNNITIGYQRSPHNTVISTNMIVSFNIQKISEGDFIEGELLYQYDTNNNVIATGEIQFADAQSISVKNVSGQFILQDYYTLVGDESLQTATIVETIGEQDNIRVIKSVSDEVLSLYTPISYYAYETFLNDNKKTIKLLDSSYKTFIEEEFVKLVKP